MEPLIISLYSEPNKSKPHRTTEYRFNQMYDDKGEAYPSITRSFRVRHQSMYNKDNVFTINKEHWPAFRKWIRDQVINVAKSDSSPLYLPSPDGVVTLTFNRQAEYKGNRYMCLQKKTGVIRPTYQNLPISNDHWDHFRK
jgi:hypothetical protein